MGRASRNRIGACTRGPTSRVDLAVRVFRGRNLFVSPLGGAAATEKDKHEKKCSIPFIVDFTTVAIFHRLIH